MKGGLAAMIHAMVALRDAPGRVVLHLVPDEETGGARGRACSRTSTASGCSPPSRPAASCGTRTGARSDAVTTRGTAAHVGLAHTGVNAFERMVALVNGLQGLRDEVAERGSILLLGGTIESGANFNVVPDSCTMTLDRRPNPDESVEVEKQRLLDLLAGAEVEIFQEAPSAAARTTARWRTRSRTRSRRSRASGRASRCARAARDALVRERGIPAYAYGPGALEVAHQADEHIEIPRLLRAVEIYTRTATALLGAGEARGASPAP